MSKSITKAIEENSMLRSENRRLKAEVEKLEAEIARLSENNPTLHSDYQTI